jgi:BSD domain
MTNAQKDHVASMERLAPELAVLRDRLCPDLMTEDSFYKIYFVLLHPRLNEHDSELLSTQQVMVFSLVGIDC